MVGWLPFGSKFGSLELRGVATESTGCLDGYEESQKSQEHILRSVIDLKELLVSQQNL